MVDATRTESWSLAWFAVWSPFVAWVCTFLGLWASKDFNLALRGFVVGLVGVIGVFVAVGGAVDSLLSTLQPTDAPAREDTRLALLSLAGVVVSLIGYGGLVVVSGFLLLLSPFQGIQH